VVTLSGTFPPAVTRSDDEEREDLIRDLEALREPGQEHPSASAACTKPAILRRLAGRAARQVGADTDRLVAAVQDGPLAAAVSLHTGVPFALVDGSEVVAGDLHRGERVVFVAYRLDAVLAEGQASLATALGLGTGGSIAVLAEPGSAAAATAVIAAPSSGSGSA
jgi:hypothetical protein